MSEIKPGKPTSGWFAAKWLLGFFGVMFLANAVFVWFALSTHTGTQTKNPYEEGLNHNQVLEQARKQELLGWSVSIEVEKNSINFSVVDKSGNMVEGLEVEVFLFSPQSEEKDQTIKAENAALGHFSIGYTDQMKGQWELRLKLSKDGETAEFRRKLVLP